MQVDTTILGLDSERAKELPYIASMGIYVFSKDAMLRLLRDNFPSANDFGSEVIPGATEIGMRVRYALEACSACYSYYFHCCNFYLVKQGETPSYFVVKVKALVYELKYLSIKNLDFMIFLENLLIDFVVTSICFQCSYSIYFVCLGCYYL